MCGLTTYTFQNSFRDKQSTESNDHTFNLKEARVSGLMALSRSHAITDYTIHSTNFSSRLLARFGARTTGAKRGHNEC